MVWLCSTKPITWRKMNCPLRPDDGADCLPHSVNVRVFYQRKKSAHLQHGGRPWIENGRLFLKESTCLTKWNVEEIAETAVSLLGQLAHASIWSQILFSLAVIINLVVAFFYPIDTDGPAPDPLAFETALALPLWSKRPLFLLYERHLVEESRAGVGIPTQPSSASHPCSTQFVKSNMYV